MSSDLETAVAVQHPDLLSRWAPWWIYVLVIVPASLGKEELLPSDAAWWLRGAVTATIVVGGIAVITAVYRASRAARVP